MPSLPNEAPTGTVEITGSAAEDEILTASNTLDDGNGMGTVSYQWMRDGMEIDFATDETYSLTQDDVGAVITVVASYTDGEGYDEAVASSPTAAVSNVNDAPTGALWIHGDMVVGSSLSPMMYFVEDEDGRDAAPNTTFQWRRDGIEIDGATDFYYEITLDDVATVISLVATYTDNYGTEETIVSADIYDAVDYGDLEITGADDVDTIEGHGGEDVLAGKAGDDALSGGAGHDILKGGLGEDVLKGNLDADELFGGAGNDLLKGGADDDVLKGNSGNDQMQGGTGADHIRGGSGDDFAWGNSGADEICGGAGNDMLSGGGNDDVLHGNNGDDLLKGGAGDDMLFGDSGQDRLIGGQGDDVLQGGTGADVFVFNKNAGFDTITDFNAARDVIEITSGASRMNHLDFTQNGDDAIVAFADTEIRVENISVDTLQDADLFLFT